MTAVDGRSRQFQELRGAALTLQASGTAQVAEPNARPMGRPGGSFGQPSGGLLVQVVFGALAFLALFSPYVVGSVRLFQPVLFVVTAWALIDFSLGVKSRVRLTALMFPWALIALVAAVGYVAGYRPVEFRWQSALSPLDSLAVLFASGIVTAWVLSRGMPWQRLLRLVASTLVVFVLVNLAVQLTQVAFGTPEWATIWWTGSDSNVARIGAIEAAANRRYVGLISQPAELGVINTLALSSAFLVLRKRKATLIAVASLVVLSGLLAQTKAFLVLGLFLILINALWSRGRANLLAIVLASAVAVFFLYAGAGARLGWTGQARLFALLGLDGQGFSPWGDLTGNRFGESSAISEALASVEDSGLNPLYGFGLSIPSTPTDSQYLLVFFWAGLIGLIAFIFFQFRLISFHRIWASNWASHEPHFADFLRLVLVYSLFMAVGFPIWVANHVGFFLVAIATVMSIRQRPGRGKQQTTQPAEEAVSVHIEA